jgi:hypothetical protein
MTPLVGSFHNARGMRSDAAGVLSQTLAMRETRCPRRIAQTRGEQEASPAHPIVAPLSSYTSSIPNSWKVRGTPLTHDHYRFV